MINFNVEEFRFRNYGSLLVLLLFGNIASNNVQTKFTQLHGAFKIKQCEILELVNFLENDNFTR